MAATVRVYAASAGSAGNPVYNIVDTNPTDNPSGTKVSFSLADAYNDTASPITIPASGNRRFSDFRDLCLYVTVAAATTLSNLKVAQATGITAGLELHVWNTPFAKAGYVLNTNGTNATSNPTTGTNAGTHPADDAITTGTAPTGYANLPTDPTYYTFDATGGSANAVGQVGKFATIVAAVLGTYAGGGNASTTLPNIKFQYDEA